MEKFDSHHAFLIQDDKAAAEVLYAELQKDKTIEASFIFEKNLTIETARDIKDIVAQTTHKSLRYIIVSAYSVGHEAQNALLKTLEELPATKKIIFFVESIDGLLPTFVSRFSKESSVLSESKKEGRASFTPGALLKDAEKICKDIKDETETKSAATRFLDELIVYKKNDHEATKKLLYFRSCIGKPSASVKQLLESAIAIAC
jgi:hypothetical protein